MSVHGCTTIELRNWRLERKRLSPSLPTKEEERVGERSLVLLDFPSPRSFLAERESA